MSDYISRQAAIDAFEDTTFTKNEIQRRLSELTSAQPDDYAKGYNDAKREIALSGEYERAYQRGKEDAQKWIPCSERLPDDFYVLCCDDYGEMLIANPFECDDSDTGFSAESEDCYMYNCIAWMPLPEPYKGEET